MTVVDPGPARRRARPPAPGGAAVATRGHRPPAPLEPGGPARRPAAFVLLLVLVGALTVVGLVMVLSASSVQALRNHGSSWYFFNRQVAWVVVGTAAMLVTSRIHYRHWRRLGAPLLAVTLVLMVLVLVPGVGIRVSGSSRWLGYGPLRMQPSELAKLALVLFGADLLARRADRMGEWGQTARPLLAFYGAVAVLLLAQPDLGTALVTGAAVVSLLFLAGTPMGTMSVLGAAGAAGVLVLAKIEPYRWRRMTSFLDPFADAANTGYQAAQARVALASGGLTGLGLGASRSKWGFLPAAHTDFIFAVVGEELGLAGALVVVALFAGLAAVGVRIALRAPDRFGMLVAGGITAWIVGQAVVNLGAVVGLLPITGVPLPFVSAGGSSLVPLMAAIGLLLNISLHGRPPAARPSRPTP
ncbi:MAG TPA: putative lipid II flippase FtsW [Acidimicrobiales bacterium]|nr:putative lipid II flippase FtsW [Acidimicrobiales bacterium]